MTKKSYDTVRPSESVTLFASGSTPSKAALTHLAPAGMTLVIVRRLSDRGLAPPPTRVHSGWYLQKAKFQCNVMTGSLATRSRTWSGKRHGSLATHQLEPLPRAQPQAQRRTNSPMGVTRFDNANLARDALSKGAGDCQAPGAAPHNQDSVVFTRARSRRVRHPRRTRGSGRCASCKPCGHGSHCC